MKITKRQLQKIIKECLLIEGPMDWMMDFVKNKAKTEYNEAKFRLFWEKELLLSPVVQPFMKALLKQIPIEGKSGERIAQAWAAVGHDKFMKALELPPNQVAYFLGYLGAVSKNEKKVGAGDMRVNVDVSNLSKIIADLGNEESDLFKHAEKLGKGGKRWKDHFGG